MSKRNEKHDAKQKSGSSDPRLRSFLRQAAAIISAERGLNERSRVKLQTLADHTGLPEDLLQSALDELQQSDEAFTQLNHWERDFVKQLNASFQGLSNKILTVSGEARIIANAESRFQINRVRARQLIDHCAENLGVARVSTADAEEYVGTLVKQKIGNRTTVEDDTRSELHQVGREWGVKQNLVDQQILDVLNANRVKFRPRRNLRLVLVGVLTATMAGLLAVGTMKLWRSRLKPVQPTIAVETPQANQPTVIPLFPSWWSESTREMMTRLSDRKPWLAIQRGSLKSVVAEQRQQALVEVVQLACSEPMVDEPELFELIARLLVDEPNDDVFRHVIDSNLKRLSPSPRTVPSLIAEVETSLAAGRLILKISEWVGIEPTSRTRAAVVDQTLTGHLGSGIESLEPQRRGRYVATQIATDYWNQLIQTSWASPSRAANLLTPLLPLTRDLFPPAEFNQFRSRALLSILQTDSSQWRQLRAAIADAVEAADDVKLQQWISIFENCRDLEFRDFLGPALLGRNGDRTEALTRQEIRERLVKLQTDFRYRRHQSLLDRHQETKGEVQRALGELNIDGNLNRPNFVATLMRLSNQSLSLSIQVQRAPAYEFESFDRIVADRFESLAEMISLANDRQDQLLTGTTQPSVSELENKSKLIDRLLNAEATPSSRQSALDRLAELAHRFEDLDYIEADMLARYLLSDVRLGEWLNIEKNLASFRHWPNLGLAIADEIPRTRTSQEQLQSLLGILYQREFKLERQLNWRTQLAGQIVREVSHSLTARLRQQPPADYLDWQRLELYAGRAYAFRCSLLQQLSTGPAELPRSQSNDPVEWSRRCLVAMERRNDPGRQASAVVESRIVASMSDIEQILFSNQFLLLGLLNRIESQFPAAANDANQILESYVALANVRTQNGARLLLLERAWLQLCELYRDKLIEELLQRT